MTAPRPPPLRHVSCGTMGRTPVLHAYMAQAKRGLDRGFKPELTLEGTGGTYFLQDAARQKVAVFKPQDEEPFAPNNPRYIGFGV